MTDHELDARQEHYRDLDAAEERWLEICSCQHLRGSHSDGTGSCQFCSDCRQFVLDNSEESLRLSP